MGFHEERIVTCAKCGHRFCEVCESIGECPKCGSVHVQGPRGGILN